MIESLKRTVKESYLFVGYCYKQKIKFADKDEVLG